VWRIAAYHVPLVISWIALMKITVRKIPAQGIRQPIKAEEDKKQKADSAGSAA